MGYSSRIMAESWESNICTTRLWPMRSAYPPRSSMSYVPEWTQEAVEKIFATHLEDWPALLRSLRSLATSVRTT